VQEVIPDDERDIMSTNHRDYKLRVKPAEQQEG
jgi:hypothetical protein